MANPKILVVEDDNVVATDIQNRLKILGYAAGATSGKEAIKKAAESRPDLVLIGAELKGEVDSARAAEHIHNHLDIPVIYVTGHSRDEASARSKATESFDRVRVLNPSEERELLTAIEKALYKHKMGKIRSFLQTMES